MLGEADTASIGATDPVAGVVAVLGAAASAEAPPATGGAAASDFIRCSSHCDFSPAPFVRMSTSRGVSSAPPRLPCNVKMISSSRHFSSS